MREPAVIILSGIPGAGKTTVGALLARRFQRGVHVEADRLHLMIVSGGLWPDGEPQDEAMRQLRLRGRNACLLADSFFAAGFTVVVDDVVIGSRLAEFEAALKSRPLYFVLLTPDPEVVAARDAGRVEKHVFEVWGHLDTAMRAETPRVGLWLDSSAMTPAETVDAVLERLEPEARIG